MKTLISIVLKSYLYQYSVGSVFFPAKKGDHKIVRLYES